MSSPLIGAGGMGEVYRARDTKLRRDVAIKVLPDLVSSDPERIARFEREARALATLSHPNIAVIHGLEETAAAGPGHASGSALIMELVDGATLADRLLQGPLPVDDALEIAGQIADALEAAHEKGIVHRDLKPANVKITPGGLVKVLDFGLARMVAEASGQETVTVATTGSNVVMGTPAYMAPEQAQGRPVDKRADIWAFGVLLYEMLAGHRPFAGGADPDWGSIPPKVQSVLRRCLERDSRRRLRDVGDFRFLIELASSVDRSIGRPSRLWPLALAAMLGFGAGALWLASRPVPSPVVRTIIAAETLTIGTDRNFAFTPDATAWATSAATPDRSSYVL